jgi:GrpB-like predicted nucleotidyltransferase (UPF0157 family)/predicted acetyltransferase
MLELRHATAGDQAALSAMLADSLRELGSPPDYPWLPLYGQEPGRYAYLLRDVDRTAGFALLRDIDADTAEVAEFYLQPGSRRRGLGRLALQALRTRHPQAWRVEVFADRGEALAFWRSVLESASVERSRPAADGERARIAFHVPASFAADAALGVRGGLVRLAAHASAWAALFAQERARIETALGPLALEVQHVGSTAVPGLDAKPIIDIAVAAANAQQAGACVPRLKTIGYRDLGARSEQIGRLLERVGERGRTHCIHLLEIASPHYRDYLLVRDHLRSSVAARAEYQVVKRTLALAHAQDRRAYTAAKNAAVKQLIAQARARRAILAAAGLSFPIGRPTVPAP